MEMWSQTFDVVTVFGLGLLSINIAKKKQKHEIVNKKIQFQGQNYPSYPIAETIFNKLGVAGAVLKFIAE